ncbi:MAG: hypothetical protein JNN08_29060 [Bryobacterales bacterium]|nr:hypothetical protein [Bryobacterales bacterium]
MTAPGPVDVEFAGPDGNLKYTFLVCPGADPSTLTPDGRLDIVTPAGGFKPVSWQESNNLRQPVRTASSVPWYRTWQIGLGWLGWSSPGGVLTHFSPAVYGGNLFIAGQSSNGDLWWWNSLSNSWTNLGNKNVAANSRFAAGAR